MLIKRDEVKNLVGKIHKEGKTSTGGKGRRCVGIGRLHEESVWIDSYPPEERMEKAECFISVGFKCESPLGSLTDDGASDSAARFRQ